MKSYIQVQLMKYGNPPSASGTHWATPIDCDRTVTLRLSNIVSVRDEYAGKKVRGADFICIITMTNGKDLAVTYETAREVLKAWKTFLDEDGSIA